jgi:hypothetical protein
MNLWKCCNRQYASGIKKCRQCGKSQPVYGVIDKPKKEAKKRKPDNHLIGTEEQFYVSTLLMEDGRTAEDIKKERARQ